MSLSLLPSIWSVTTCRLNVNPFLHDKGLEGNATYEPWNAIKMALKNATYEPRNAKNNGQYTYKLSDKYQKKSEISILVDENQ